MELRREKENTYVVREGRNRSAKRDKAVYFTNGEAWSCFRNEQKENKN